MRSILITELLLAVLIVLICFPLHAQSTPSPTVQELQAQIDELKQEVEALKALLKEKSEMTSIEPAIEEPSAEPTPSAPAATLLPDISVIGNVVGRFSNRPIPDRNQILLDELELGVQSYVYPDVRADVILAADRHENMQVTLEEGYLSFLQLGNTPLSARVGKLLLPFGKLNTYHPHQWPFVDRPFVLTNYLGDHGLSSNGAFVQYLLPTGSKWFVNLEIGRSAASGYSHEHIHEADEEEHQESPSLFDKNLTNARLWTSRALGELSELELGVSYASGRTTPGEELNGRDPLRLWGVDLTWRSWPDTYKRWLFLGEWLRQRRSFTNGSASAQGYYLFGEYKWDRYMRAGLRYDWSELPVPETAHQSGLTAILTRDLTESTALRLQYTRAREPDFGSYNRYLLQVLYGFGPHSHPLK